MEFKKSIHENLIHQDSDDTSANSVDCEGGSVAEDPENKPRNVVYNMSQSNMQNNFCNNSIRTAKYSVITFIPLNLYTQFSKASNLYFLLIAYMQTVKRISITGGKSMMSVPLGVVVLVSMIKDAFEDYQRHKSDNEENSKITHVYNSSKGEFEGIKWSDCKPGMLVKVNEDEFFPADMVVMQSSDSGGGLYVETKNLDGETNLKSKAVYRKLNDEYSGYQDADWKNLQGTIVSEQPNNAIYKFEGFLKKGDQNIPLDVDTFVLRGCKLRNTSHIIGMIVFTGHETKIMKNSAQAKYKFSTLEIMSNQSIALVLVTQLVIALCGSSVGTSWRFQNDNATNLDADTGIQPAYYLSAPGGDNEEGFFTSLLLGSLTWVIIFTNMVPISLMVQLEICKMFQATFMGWDIEMYDHEQQVFTRAQASNLNEELGQVEYIFSDKTGTLTCNIMEFKKFSAGYTSYGTGKIPETKQEPNVNFHDDQLLKDVENQKPELKDVILCMALCHTVILDEKKNQYTSASPDELALVYASKQFGYEFIGMSSDQVIKIKVNENDQEYILRYKLLNTCEFTSTRKRQSSILQNLETEEIILYTKGADNVIKELLSKDIDQSEMVAETEKFVDDYAKDGLRTLFLGKKEIQRNDYDAWNKKFEQAQLSTVNREAEMAKVNGEIEQGIVLIGSTAIEDRLQDDVDQTIQFAKSAGVKVWVLTGDKIGTAINIGFSAGLLDDSEKMDQHIIREDSNVDKLIQELANILGDLKRLDMEQQTSQIISGSEHVSKKKQAIIVAGASLVLLDHLEICKEHFLEITDRADVVLACRVSPKQKADIVCMIKQRYPNKTTLSIGDGANDVAMILQAHVGVGILGKEGQQAARSADYAIGQFKFLKPLLFYHGREAYRRNSYMILYTFYKNFLYVCTQFYFGFYSAFSGQTLYEQFMYQMYNITMTSLPIMWYACFDFEKKRKRRGRYGLNQEMEQRNKTEQYEQITRLGSSLHQLQMEQELNRDDLNRKLDDRIDLKADEYLSNPILYQIGINRHCFTRTLFMQWIFYALWHAFIIFYVVLYGLNQPTTMQSDGKDIGFWLAGMTVFGICIFVANFELAQRFNTHTVLGGLTLSVGCVCYFLFYFVLSYVFKGNIDHLFIPTFKIGLVWVTVLFCLGQTYVVEKIFNYLYFKYSCYSKAAKEQREEFIRAQKKKEFEKIFTKKYGIKIADQFKKFNQQNSSVQ